MTSENLTQAIEDIPSLRAVFITAMPDCLLFDSWIRADSEWSAEQVAAYFGDVFRANREGLKALGTWSTDLQITIETPDQTVLMMELSEHFVCTFIFERSAALGMARLYVRRCAERVKGFLPSFDVSERPRGVRIIEFLHRYAPDPHAVLMRVALRTGLSMKQLETAESLTDEQVRLLEDTACGILGMESLSL